MTQNVNVDETIISIGFFRRFLKYTKITYYAYFILFFIVSFDYLLMCLIAREVANSIRYIPSQHST